MRASPPLRIEIVSPAPRGVPSGNRVTALRWAKRLRELGARVSVAEKLGDAASDLVIALHAAKGAEALERARFRSPRTPTVVALTGTDVYGSLDSPAVSRSLSLATRIVALQPRALEALAPELRSKARVIVQSSPPA